MKILLQKNKFLEKLELASRFTSSRLVSSTSLQGVCLKGEDNIIHFYSTDLNYYYHSVLKIENNNKFKIIIEPKKIIEFLSLLPEIKIEMEIKEKAIVISQGKIKGQFPLFSDQEFPFPPEKTGEKQKIKTSFFKESLPFLLFAASTDETRPVLTGINFVTNDDELQLVTTDGFRLSLLTLKKDLPFSSMIIPAGFLSNTQRFINKETEIEFNYLNSEKLLAFFIGDNDIYVRMIEGEYPPFEKVIPVEKKTTVIIDADEFLRSVKLVSIFTKEFSNIIILGVEKDLVKLVPKVGREEEDVVYQEAKTEGEAQKIAFNYKYLIDFLNCASGKKIIIELLRSDAPVVFKIEGVSNFFHIIMPVRIQE
ncbi:DNA polymerase III subunit beta [Candidatus Roizmanbacteria bacterium]|nr:DNA polymerase III subunit beta [Candidatus Roizmanbacteria bacterium]